MVITQEMVDVAGHIGLVFFIALPVIITFQYLVCIFSMEVLPRAMTYFLIGVFVIEVILWVAFILVFSFFQAAKMDHEKSQPQ
jgi:uncharacterized membrane protein